MKLVVVEWVDSCSLRNGWKGLAEAKTLKPSRIRSVGWIVSQDDKQITVASHWDEMDNICGEMCIPKGCIIKVTEL